MGDERKKFFKYIIIFGIIVVIEVIILFFIQNDFLTIKNKQKTLGVIVDIVDTSENFSARGDFYRTAYRGTIIVEYEVNGIKYYSEKRVKSYVRFYVPSESEYYIGREITVFYNKELPSDSAIDTISGKYNAVIYTSLAIEILIFIIFLYRKLTKKKKVCLKVITVEDIDYQRERVFFEEEKSKKLYFIDYDFGEKIKIGENYELYNTHKSNYKKQEVVFDNKNVHAYKIVDINKDSFLKNSNN